MATVFTVIAEEFGDELDALEMLLSPHASDRLTPKARVAQANAAVLLLAATFEEFIRELAREYAKAVIASAENYEKLPPKMASVAWKRAMDRMAKLPLGRPGEALSRERAFSEAQTRFAVAFEFCRGDLSQDIYQDLIHNENNMRPQELNSLFKLSGLGNVCALASETADLKSLFNEEDGGVVHGHLVAALEDFFDRRNQTAHELRAMSSVAPEQIVADIGLLRRFGYALAQTAQDRAPEPRER